MKIQQERKPSLQPTVARRSMATGNEVPPLLQGLGFLVAVLLPMVPFFGVAVLLVVGDDGSPAGERRHTLLVATVCVAPMLVGAVAVALARRVALTQAELAVPPSGSGERQAFEARRARMRGFTWGGGFVFAGVFLGVLLPFFLAVARSLVTSGPRISKVVAAPSGRLPDITLAGFAITCVGILIAAISFARQRP